MITVGIVDSERRRRRPWAAAHVVGVVVVVVLVGSMATSGANGQAMDYERAAMLSSSSFEMGERAGELPPDGGASAQCPEQPDECCPIFWHASAEQGMSAEQFEEATTCKVSCCSLGGGGGSGSRRRFRTGPRTDWLLVASCLVDRARAGWDIGFRYRPACCRLHIFRHSRGCRGVKPRPRPPQRPTPPWPPSPRPDPPPPRPSPPVIPEDPDEPKNPDEPTPMPTPRPEPEFPDDEEPGREPPQPLPNDDVTDPDGLPMDEPATAYAAAEEVRAGGDEVRRFEPRISFDPDGPGYFD